MNIYIVLTGTLVFLLFYFVMTQYFAHRRFNYLQETSIAIVIGIVVGMFIHFFNPGFFQDTQSYEQLYIRDVIILFLLPPIMFEDGYNFPRRKFFQNFQLINLFGLLGTVCNFFVIWGILYVLNRAGLFVSSSDSQEPITLLNWQILLIASALTSIEPVVTEKVVDKETYPKLFSIIFGESLYKDTLAITLFESINDFVGEKSSNSFDIGGQDLGFLMLRFLEVFSCSILIGLSMGFLVTILFKNMRFLVKEKGISEVALTVIAGFLCYVLSEWAAFSGVISMLFCGTILAHYNTYNLTEEGKSSTLIAIEVLKISACGLIFFFIGFEVFSVQSFESAIDQVSKSSFSATLLGYTMMALIVGRTVNIFLMSLLGWLVTKRGKWRLNYYQYWIIFLGGLVHGAVPFALSVTMPTNTPSSNCAQLNIIAVVLTTSLLLNTGIPKVEKALLARIKDMEMEQPDHPSLKDSFVLAKNISGNNYQSMLIKKSGEAALMDKFMSSTQKYWKKFDEGVLKPFLIYDYYQRRDQIKLEKIKKRMEEHYKFMNRFSVSPENILNLENEDQNVFYEISHASNSSSGTEEKGVVKYRLSKVSKDPSHSHHQQRMDEEGPSDRSCYVSDNDTERWLKPRASKLPENCRQRRVQTELVPFPQVKEERRQMSEHQIEIRIEESKTVKNQGEEEQREYE